MATFVIPFRPDGKTRLGDPEIALAMFFDVRSVVRAGSARWSSATHRAAREPPSRRRSGGLTGPVAIVNADLPCVDGVRAARAARRGACARRRPRRDDECDRARRRPRFPPAVRPGSAARFGLRQLELIGLREDVDTWDDLLRVAPVRRAGDARRARSRTADSRGMNVAVLSGGVGGAKFVRALVETLGGENVTAIVNVGDDLEILGQYVCPDVDSVVYALAGLADDERGWGRADETWNALATVTALGGEDWFSLGDRDLGLHLVRTQALRAGESLSSVTARVTRALGLDATVLPASDDELRTFVVTPAGTFSFQEWFVARRHRDEVDAVDVRGSARPAPGVLEALASADLLLIGPSNPYVSVGPILAVAEIRDALERRACPVRRRQPARRRTRGEGPGRPHARAARGRHDARARRVVLPGLDRRARRSTRTMRRTSWRCSRSSRARS